MYHYGIGCAAVTTILFLLPHTAAAQIKRPGYATFPTVTEVDSTRPYEPGFCEPDVVYAYARPNTTLSAAFYYPWYIGSPDCTPGGDFTRWCNCIWEPKPQNPRPTLGFYDSSTPSVVGTQLDQMVEHQINVVGIEWTAKDEEVSNIVNVVIPAIASRNLQFVLLYDLQIRFAGIGLNFDDDPVHDRFIDDLTLFGNEL